MMMWDIHRVGDIGKGFLAVMPRPAGPGAFDRIAGSGVRTVVSLLEVDEARRLGLHEEAQWCQARGMYFESFPIRDHSLPVDREAVKTFALQLHRRIQQGEGVAIHCFAGIGRTGMLASCVLMVDGLDAQSAMDRVSAARGFPVPDTDEQFDWICEQQRFY